MWSRLSDAGLAWPLQRALLRVRGADARSFLHRLSTQHCAARAPGDSCLNAFITRQGRMVELVHQLHLADDEVWLWGSRPDAGALRDWLESFHFTEEVDFEEAPPGTPLWCLAGREAPAVLARVLGSEPGGDPGRIWRGPRGVAVESFPFVDAHGARVPSYWVMPAASAGGDNEEPGAAFVSAGAVLGDGASYEVARIAAGIPAFPGEVSDRLNPLELALRGALHWDKGCYIGQEVVARIENYGKQSRHLVALRIAAAHLAQVAPGDPLLLEGGEAGQVTSVAPAAWADHAGALAWLRTRTPAPGLTLRIRSAGGEVDAVLHPRAAAEVAG